MKTILVIFLCITTSLSLLGQEKLNDSIIEYRFDSEMKYKIIGNDSSFIFVQSNDSALKMSFTDKKMPGFVIIDTKNEITAAQLESKIDIKPFIEIPKIEEQDGIKLLKKIDDRMYKNYECESYQFDDGLNSVELYFLKEPSPSFNNTIMRFLNMMGLSLNIDDMPKGTFVAGVEIKEGIAKDKIELITLTKNRDILFTLNTKL